MNTKFHDRLLGTIIRCIILKRLQDFGQFVAQEDRDNSRRCLVGAQTVIVLSGCDRQTKKVLIAVHSLDDGAEES